MLLDDHAVEDVLFTQKTLEALPATAVHISLSTISVDLAQRLEAAHAAINRPFLSAPVFGRPNVAAEGKLWLVVAGESTVIEQVRSVLELISRGHTVAGSRPSQANALKLAGNFMISSMIASLSEAFTVVESQAVDPGIFLETVNSALFQSPFLGTYGRMMIEPPKSPGATMKLGAKDTRLFREVARSGPTPTPLADLYQRQFEAAIEAGRGDEDWAAGYLQQTRIEAKT